MDKISSCKIVPFGLIWTKITSIVDQIHLKFDRIHEHLFRSNRQRNFQYFEKSQCHINV
eukprot:UN06743